MREAISLALAEHIKRGSSGEGVGAAIAAAFATEHRAGLATYLLAYLLVASVGAIALPQVTPGEPIWPAFGVYLAGLMRRDPRQWPALVLVTLLGDFALTMGLLQLTPRESGWIATELTLEALTAAFLLYTHSGVRARIHTATDVMVLLGATCIAAPSVGTAFEIATSAFVGEPATPAWGRFVDDILPSLIVAPLAVSALGLNWRWARVDWRRPAEAMVLLAALVAICSYALGNEVQALFLTIVPVIWAAKRFGTLGASGALMLIAIFATNYLAQGRGPFAVEFGDISLKIYLGVVAGIGLPLAAAKNEREDALRALHAAGEQLEALVDARTRELRASEEKLRLAADAVGFGAYEYDLPAACVVLSDQAMRALGIPQGNLSRDAYRDLVDAADRGGFELAKSRSLNPAYGGEGEIEYRIVRPDNQVRWVHDKWRVLFENGAPVRALGALMDVTERKHIEEKLRESEVEAGRQSLQGTLLSSVSHDLRTPIATIIASATSLQAHEAAFGPETRRDMYAEIVAGGERLDRYVANLLSMTRMESGVVDPQCEWIDPIEVVRGALSQVRRRSLPQTLIEAFEGGGASVFANRVLLEQALVNVIENAIAYSPAGTSVQVGARQAGGEIILTVEDEGLGIAADELPFVFDKFFRGQSDRRRSVGVGLGLSVARGIVESFGGAISAESPVFAGGGTRMTIRLPVSHDRGIGS